MTAIAAIMMVRNEEAILATTVGHLLNTIGVDHLVVADNGSTDATQKILQRLAKLDGRVRWTDASGPWNPSSVLTELAREAHRKGIDWVVPNDADEFYWFGSSSIRTLCSSTKSAGFVLDVRNFVQWRWVRRNHPRAIETMIFSSNPVGGMSDAQRLVQEGEIAFVQMFYPPKLILRTSPSLTIHRGDHSADGTNGVLGRVTGIEVLHAPIPAANDLEARISAAARLEEVESFPSIGWHLRRLLKVVQEGRLREEWNANSTRTGVIGPPRRKRWLRFDPRLRGIALKQRRFVSLAHAGIPDYRSQISNI